MRRKNWIIMKENITYKTLIAFEDGLLAPERMREVADAIKSDEMIRALWEEIAITRKENPDADLEVALGIEFSDADEDAIKESPWSQTESSNKWRWLAAASIVGLALGTFWFFSINGQDEISFASIKDDSFTQVENLRGSQEDWQVDYNNGKWENVISALENKPDRTLSDEFYLGLAYFKTGKSKQAIPHLEISLKSEILLSDASFALAQCYYELKDKTRAQKYLEQTTHPKRGALSKLVEKL